MHDARVCGREEEHTLAGARSIKCGSKAPYVYAYVYIKILLHDALVFRRLERKRCRMHSIYIKAQDAVRIIYIHAYIHSMWRHMHLNLLTSLRRISISVSICVCVWRRSGGDGERWAGGNC